MPRRSLQPNATATSESETWQTLLGRSHRQTGRMPAESIVRHVLSVTQGGDWPVQRDALDAVLRRYASARTDEIQIVARPRGRLVGLYATRRRGSRARPYRTLLRRIEPLDGSCECADFLRNSLGLCKHLLAVLEHAVSKRRRGDVESAFEPAPLRWDPVRPLTGPGDWLAQVRWVDGTPGRDLRRWLRPADGNDWRVTVPGPSPQRLALVHQLLDALRDGDGEPALHALLQQECARLARRIQSASAGKQLHHALQTLKQPLYPYQREGVDRFFEQGRLLLADDMGLGKTAQAIAACTPYGTPAASGAACSLSLPRSSRSGFESGRPLPTRLPPSSTGHPPSAALRSTRAVADSFWGTTSSSFATLRSFASGRRTSSCSTRPSGSRTGRPRPRSP